MQKINSLDGKRIFYVFLILIFLLGFIFRTYLFIECNVFDDDECRLLLAFLEASLLNQLFLPLDGGQSAPPLFSILSKFVANISGYSEYALHFIPYVASVFSIFVFYKVAREYLNKNISVLFAVFLLAINKNLIIFSSIFKQYSTDVLVSVLCLYFFPKLDINNMSNKKFGIVVLIMILLPFISLPSLFFIGAFWIINFVKNYKDKTFLLKATVFAIPFFVVLLYYYFFNLAPSKMNMEEIFPHYWDDGFWELSFNDFIRIIAVNFRHIFAPNKMILPMFILAFSGIALFLKEKRFNSYFIVLVFVLALTASLFHIYPYMGRVVLYMFPISILFISKALDYKNKFIFGMVIMLLFVSFYKYDFKYLKNLTNYEEFYPHSPKNLLVSLMENFNPEKDIILVNSASDTSFIFYSSKINFNTDKVYEMEVNSSDKELSIKYLNNLQSGHRYWFYLIKDYGRSQIYPIVLPWLEEQEANMVKQERDSFLYCLEK